MLSPVDDVANAGVEMAGKAFVMNHSCHNAPNVAQGLEMLMQ